MTSDQFPGVFWVSESHTDLTDGLYISIFEKSLGISTFGAHKWIFPTSLIWEATKRVSGLQKIQFSKINTYPQVIYFDLQA